MNEYIENLKHSLAPCTDEAYALNQIKDSLYKRAKEAILNAFRSLGKTYFRICDYAPEFEVSMDDNLGNVRLVEVNAVEIYDDHEILLLDAEGYGFEESEWGDHIFEVMNTIIEALNKKVTDLKRLKKGVRVKWIDPAIDDYDPDDREEQLELIWVIDDCPELDELDSDSVIAISNEYGEAEVLPWELVYVDDGE